MLHNDYREMGGEFFSVRLEAKGIREAGHDVELLTEDNDRFSGAALAERIVRPNISRLLVGEAIDRFDPDIVHVQNLFPILGAGAVEAIRERSLPWVRSIRNFRLRCLAATCFRDGGMCLDCSSAARGVQGVMHSCYRGSAVQSAASLLYASSEAKAVSRWPPAVHIILSKAMASLLPESAADIPQIVKFNPVEDPGHVGLQILGPRFDAVFMGRLSPEKRPRLMVDIARALPDRTFAVVGQGPEGSLIQREAAQLPNLKVLGALPHKDAMSVLASSRAAIVPALWSEPFGRVAAESLAVGTPPLVSNVGGLPELVSGVSTNLVVDSMDTSHWVERLLRLWAVKPEESLRGECRARWIEAFEPTANSRELEAIYRQVVGTAA